MRYDFNLAPFIVIWEMTQACALRCVHCRAEAMDHRHPGELTTDQGRDLIREIASFQDDPNGAKPLVVLTGGDPMRRPDALDIVEYGTRLGLRITMTPSGTDAMTCRTVRALKDRGLKRLAVSLDASDEDVHDSFRQVRGSYRWTMRIIRWAHEVGLPVQINTTVTRHNLDDIESLGTLMASLDITLWSVFFLIPTGRGRIEDAVSAEDHERIFHQMYTISCSARFDVKSTEAPHYRRVVVQRMKKENRTRGDASSPLFGRRTGDGAGIRRAPQGVNAGNGFVFVSHTGGVQPSGFLPLSAGNVKRDSLASVYRHSELFEFIRDYSKLKGKCGVCGFRFICGGSRSRAYAVLGDYMASDPCCVYQPEGYPVEDKTRQPWEECS